jgi:hypothetical protein
MRRGPRIPALIAALVISVVVSACGSSATPAPSGPVDSPLPAGTHSSAAFQPTVTFTVPDGWALSDDSADYLQLRPAGQDLLGIHMFRGVSAMSQDPSCPVQAEPGVGTSSVELMTWIRSLDGLSVTSPAMVSVGGLLGSSIDIAIKDGWTQSCSFANGLPTVPLLVDPGTGLQWVIAGGERLRLYLLDLPDGGTLIVDVDDFEGSQFEQFLPDAMSVVNSFQFAS